MRVLLVGLGSGGGVGRYEQLLQAALQELHSRGQLEWRGVWRRAHPAYLGAQRAADAAGDGSVRSLMRRVAASSRWHPDVVCFSHINVARLGPLLPLAAIKAPYIVGALGVEVWSPLHWSKRLPLTRAAQVYAISDYTREKVLSMQGIAPARCSTLHLALEDHWRATADAHPPYVAGDVSSALSESFSLLTVCRLERDARDKGVDWVLRAVAALAPGHPELRYVVVGDGDDRSHLEGMATELGIQDRVEFRGRVGHDGLLAAYRDCDLFVLPTRREGFGLVFLEAMAYRKPIVAVAAAGTLDVVTSGEEGLLVRDEAELVDAIATLIGDRALRLRMGEAGYRTLSTPFSFDAFVMRLSALLADVCRAPRGSKRLSA